MGIFRREQFKKAATDARTTLFREGRATETVLGFVIQTNLTPVVGQHGAMKGKMIVKVRVCPLLYWSVEDGKLHARAAFGTAVRGMLGEEAWVELAEVRRIRQRTLDVIGLVPPCVRYHLCGTSDPQTRQKALDWLFRLFGAMERLNDQKWADVARIERQRMADVIGREEAEPIADKIAA